MKTLFEIHFYNMAGWLTTAWVRADTEEEALAIAQEKHKYGSSFDVVGDVSANQQLQA